MTPRGAATRRSLSAALLALLLALFAPRAAAEEVPADLADDPAGLAAFARTVLAAGRAERYGEVERALGEALASHPDEIALHLVLGQILLAQARTTTSTGVEQAAAVRARAAFARVLDAEPHHVEAALGLARALELGGRPADAVAVLDRALAGATSPALVTEKGRILYEDASGQHEAAGGTYPLPADVTRAFRRAQGALLGATSASPQDVGSWLRLAWASQILGDVETARQGYRGAIAVAPDDPLPLRGLSVLYTNDPTGYEAELRRLAAEGPAFERVLLLQAQDRIARQEYDEAERVLEAFLATHPEDADGFYALGRVRAAQGRIDEADGLYRRAVEADGDHLAAAEAVDQAIRKTGLGRAKANLDAALDVESEYAWLLDRAPNNPFVRNNVAFLLREAWLAHREDPAWRPLLDAAVAYYDDAVRVIGPWSPEKHRELPWSTRHAFAQIVNDAGVIRHLYEPARDLARAEHDYLEAMRYTTWGYVDAWTYLRRIYEEQERWPELHRLARRAAEGLADAKGEPLVDAREAARALAARLEADGKVEADLR